MQIILATQNRGRLCAARENDLVLKHLVLTAPQIGQTSYSHAVKLAIFCYFSDRGTYLSRIRQRCRDFCSAVNAKKIMSPVVRSDGFEIEPPCHVCRGLDPHYVLNPQPDDQSYTGLSGNSLIMFPKAEELEESGATGCSICCALLKIGLFYRNVFQGMPSFDPRFSIGLYEKCPADLIFNEMRIQVYTPSGEYIDFTSPLYLPHWFNSKAHRIPAGLETYLGGS